VGRESLVVPVDVVDDLDLGWFGPKQGVYSKKLK
jgi:hypothetical protein